jgi:hypothetical protein
MNKIFKKKMNTIKVPCFIFAKVSKNNYNISKKKVTKKKIFNAIKHAKLASQKSTRMSDNIILWNHVDDLTLQYYDENIHSEQDIEWLYNMTKDL